MQEWLQEKKPVLIDEMERHLAVVSKAAAQVSPWAPDLLRVLLPFSSQGKMIRGSLVSLGLKLFDENPPDCQRSAANKTGAVMELFQSLLLIHDDIMDQDDFRRGKPSVHYQYRLGAQNRGDRQEQRLGENLGICMGDVSGFLGFEILADLDLEPIRLKRLIRLCSRELCYVGLAQMEDVHNGFRTDEPSIADIIKLYRYKTGRYTFSLPLMAGAIIAGQGEDCLELLGELGELYGIIFQIKDDEIGLFAPPETSGKPQGSDIKEDKKTLYRYYIFARASVDERARLAAIYGNKSAGQAEIEWVLNLHRTLGIEALVSHELASTVTRATILAEKIQGLTAFGHRALTSVLRYNQERTW